MLVDDPRINLHGCLSHGSIDTLTISAVGLKPKK